MQVLEQLAVGVDPRVHVAVAMKNKLSKDLMLTLAKDSDSSVRERVAFNKNASDDVLRLLAQDNVGSVSEAARHRDAESLSPASKGTKGRVLGG